MAKWVFKLRGLGTDPDVVRAYTVGDAATTRALNKHREDTETNEQVLDRLWAQFITENVVNKDYVVRKDAALATAAAGITKIAPSVETAETP